jgi:hypothetical protein
MLTTMLAAGLATPADAESDPVQPEDSSSELVSEETETPTTDSATGEPPASEGRDRTIDIRQPRRADRDLAAAGCTDVELSTWEGDLSSVTIGDNPTCATFISGAAGNYFLRGAASAGVYPYFEVYDGDDYVTSFDYSNIATVSLGAGREYRIDIYEGGEPGEEVFVGVFATADSTGCGAVTSTAWDAAPTTISFPTSSTVACHRIDAVTGDRIRVTNDEAADALSHTVVNASGAQVCSAHDGNGMNACRLTGTGPWWVLSYLDTSSYPDPPTSTDMWVNNYAQTTGCDTESLATWGASLPIAGDRSVLPVTCVTVTTGAAGRYYLRLENTATEWDATVEVHEATGEHVTTISRGWPEQLSLKGGHTYRLLVAGDPDGYDAGYELGVYEYAALTGCDAIASTAWDADPTTLSFDHPNTIDCRLVDASRDDRIRVADDVDSAAVHLVVNAAGGEVCSAYGSTLDACRLTGTGPWRILTYYDTYGSPDMAGPLDMWVNNYADTTGCATGTLATWGVELPVTDERSENPVDCVVVTTGEAGTYLVRVADESDQWDANLEIHEATGVRVANVGSDWPQQITLKTGHAYRLLVTGDPEGYDPTYRLGVFDLADDTGCDPLTSTGWDATANTLAFPTQAELECRSVTGATGTWIRLATDGTDTGTFHTIRNVAHHEICSSPWYDDTIDACQLTGNGPWQIVTHVDSNYGSVPAGGVRMWVNSYANPTGCAQADPTVSILADRIAGARDGALSVDCYLSSIARNSVVRVEIKQSTTDPIEWSVANSDGGSECSGYGSDEQPCKLRGPAPYRLLVTGDDGAAYEFALRRITDAVGCNVISGVAAGIPRQIGTFDDDHDLRCYRFPGGAGDEFTLSAVNTNLADTHYRVELYGPDGALLGDKPDWQDEQTVTLTEPGDHVAIVSRGDSPNGTFRFTGVCENPACGPDQLTLATVSPNRPGASAAVTLSVRGKALTTDMEFALTRSGIRLVGTVLDVSADNRSANVRFDLSGRSSTWGVEVTSPEGTVVTLPDAVTVTAIRPANVSASLVALPRFVAGRTQTVSVVVTNAGNVDALGVPLLLDGLPPGSEIVPKFHLSGLSNDGAEVIPTPFDAKDMVYQGDDRTGIPIFLGSVPPEGAHQYDFEVTVHETVDYELFTSVGSCAYDQDAVDPTRGPTAQVTQADLVATLCGIEWAQYAIGFIPFGDCFNTAYDATIDIGSRLSGFSNAFTSAGWMGHLSNIAGCALSFVPGGSLAKKATEAALNGYGIIDSTSTCLDGVSELLTNVASLDPNEIVGPFGGGDQRAITGDGVHRYAVYFENDSSATAPAQEVRVTSHLDPTVYDLSTLRFRSVRFGTTDYTPPVDSPEIDHVLDLGRDDGLQLDIAAAVTPQGALTWHLSSIDPLTGTLPQDPFVGFLPPNEDGTEGQGVAFYDVELKDPANGDVVENSADIVFDLNDPIRTNTWTNLIDRDVPTATLTAPPTSNEDDFTVEWNASDPTSGVDRVDILVSVDGAPYTLWRTGPSDGQAAYPGEAGHTYALSAVARDWAGNASLIPPTPHATTVVGGIISNLAKPRIKGKLIVGKALRVTHGRWTPGTVRLRYRWFASGSPIKKATTNNLRLKPKLRGKRISVRVTATSPGLAAVVVLARKQGKVRR